VLCAASIYSLGAIVLGLLTLAATVAVPFLSLRRERPRRGLAYEVRSYPLALVRRQAQDRIQVSYEGHELHHPGLVAVRLRNRGNTPILASDFEEPLTVVLPPGAHLLDATIEDGSPADLTPRLDTDATSVKVKPLLLNPRDEFELSLLVDNMSGGIAVTARIAGISRLRENAPRTTRSWPLSPRVALALSAMALIGYAAAGFGAITTYKALEHTRARVHLRARGVVCAKRIVSRGPSLELLTPGHKATIVPRSAVTSISVRTC
jgi:hypothetical protein